VETDGSRLRGRERRGGEREREIERERERERDRERLRLGMEREDQRETEIEWKSAVTVGLLEVRRTAGSCFEHESPRQYKKSDLLSDPRRPNARLASGVGL
jgi:hypothetical protein